MANKWNWIATNAHNWRANLGREDVLLPLILALAIALGLWFVLPTYRAEWADWFFLQAPAGSYGINFVGAGVAIVGLIGGVALSRARLKALAQGLVLGAVLVVMAVLNIAPGVGGGGGTGINLNLFFFAVVMYVFVVPGGRAEKVVVTFTALLALDFAMFFFLPAWGWPGGIVGGEGLRDGLNFMVAITALFFVLQAGARRYGSTLRRALLPSFSANTPSKYFPFSTRMGNDEQERRGMMNETCTDEKPAGKRKVAATALTALTLALFCLMLWAPKPVDTTPPSTTVNWSGPIYPQITFTYSDEEICGEVRFSSSAEGSGSDVMSWKNGDIVAYAYVKIPALNVSSYPGQNPARFKISYDDLARIGQPMTPVSLSLAYTIKNGTTFFGLVNTINNRTSLDYNWSGANLTVEVWLNANGTQTHLAAYDRTIELKRPPVTLFTNFDAITIIIPEAYDFGPNITADFSQDVRVTTHRLPTVTYITVGPLIADFQVTNLPPVKDKIIDVGHMQVYTAENSPVVIVFFKTYIHITPAASTNVLYDRIVIGAPDETYPWNPYFAVDTLAVMIMKNGEWKSVDVATLTFADGMTPAEGVMP